MQTECPAAEIHNIPVWKPWGARCGVILYYAFLAYPHSAEKERRLAFARALEAFRYKNCGAKRVAIPATYRKLKSEKVMDAMNMGFRRIALRRMNAAQIAHILCFNEQEIPNPDPKPGGPDRVILHIEDGQKKLVDTLNKAAGTYVEYAASRGRHLENESALANVKHRYWADSLPVLHLATALWHELPCWEQACTSAAVMKQVLRWGIWNIDWLERALAFAEGWRLSPVVHDRIPTFVPENAISLRAIADPSEPFGL
jgi:hypothetical protein